MAYYLDMFSPQTYETFSASDRSISGFRMRQVKLAQRIHPGDRFACYLTKFSRWIGILEVTSECFVAHTPLFYSEGDPFVVRFNVRPIAWFERDFTLPIREDYIWNALSFTRAHDRASSKWTGKFRSSLGLLEEADAQFLERVISDQARNPKPFAIDEAEFKRFLSQKVRRPNGVVTVTVPVDTDHEEEKPDEKEAVRESTRIQALLAHIGESLGFSVWLPRNDRARVTRAWASEEGTLLDALPLSYDEVTLRTIEQIDVLWLRKRAIVRWRARLPNCRLQTLERYLCGRWRSGDIPSAEIPQRYHDFVRGQDARLIAPVFHHNRLDLITMIELLVAPLPPGERGNIMK